MKGKSIAHAMAILLMMIWGVSYISVKVVIQQGVAPLQLAFYRFLIASVILYLILKLKYPEERILKEDSVRMALSGVFGVMLYFLFENYSIKYTSASNVSILLSSIPVFTLISQKLVFKEKLTALKISGAVLSVIGIVIIIGSKDKISLFSSGTKGDLLAIGAALSWVAYNIVTSKFKGNYKSITITTYQAIWGCLLLFPGIFLNKLVVPSYNSLLNICFQAIFCTCFGYGIYIYCLEKLGATVITTYINLQAIVTIISAFFLINEKITGWQIMGSGIIIFGVFMVSFSDKFNIQKFLEKI